MTLMKLLRRKRRADQSSSMATMRTGSKPALPSTSQPWSRSICERYFERLTSCALRRSRTISTPCSEGNSPAKLSGDCSTRICFRSFRLSLAKVADMRLPRAQEQAIAVDVFEDRLCAVGLPSRLQHELHAACLELASGPLDVVAPQRNVQQPTGLERISELKEHDARVRARDPELQPALLLIEGL